MKRTEFIKQRNKLISQIVVLCIKVTENTKHDVFFDYSGHIDAIWIHYNQDGWQAENSSKTVKDISPKCSFIDSRDDEKESGNEKSYEIIIKNLRDYRNSLQELLSC